MKMRTFARITLIVLLIALVTGCSKPPATDEMAVVKKSGFTFDLPAGYSLDKSRSAPISESGNILQVFGPDGKADPEGILIQFGSASHAPFGDDPDKILEGHLKQGAEEAKVGAKRAYLRTDTKGALQVVTLGTFSNGNMHVLICQGPESESATFQKVRDSFRAVDKAASEN